eukprot:TRINITY_DN3599_c0_g1_i1.p1 TRINITY_DN3599_c0_g1~~TRINITY_DN3599_c0_g1_i1.p1  ORF type:complete len:140 (+),score=16.75 TRINITY_DN3599_c0_g1_i1:126-545(+)
MAPGGKGGKKDAVIKAKSHSSRAEIQFPVGRIRRLLRKGNYAPRISATAPVFLASSLEYLCAEILELAGKAAQLTKKQQKTCRINPRHLLLAIRKDNELNTLLSHVTISQGGVIPNIHEDLIPKKKSKKDHDATQSQEY